MVWTEEKIAFLKANYETMLKRDIATALGLKESQVRDKVSRLKLTLSTRKKLERQIAVFKAYKEMVKFSESEDAFVKDNYLKMPLNQLAKTMGRSRKGIEYSLERQNLSIPLEIINERKQTGRFKKGQEAHNKGVKMSSEVYEKVQKTFFKTGENRENASVTLTDNYVKWVITMHDDDVKPEEIPPNIIHLKRTEILIKRQLKNLNNGKQ